MHDSCPPLQFSNNTNPLHPNFHQRSLYITLPAANSIDNRDSLTTSTNLVILGHATENQPSTSITNSSNGCQSGLNQDTQSNGTTVVQQQQSYHHIQGPQQTFSDLSSNSLNGTNQNVASASPIAAAASTSQSNVVNSTCNTNGESEVQNLPVHS